MPEEKLIISHSEGTSFNECSRQHFYAFLLNLRPRNISTPLQFGINGHLMLEAFYNVLKVGGKYVDACQAAYDVLDQLKEDDEIDPQIAAVLELHMQKYFIKYKDIVKEWEILEVEKKLIIPLPDKPYDYGLKTDLIALFKAGKRKDKIGIVDHKFLYNFYTFADMRMHVQVPRYAWGARKSGYKIDFGLLAQIRYRTFKDYRTADLFKHEPIELKPARMENAMLEFYKSADEIWERRQLTLQKAEYKAKRSLSRLVCKHCDFDRPCESGIDGMSERNILLADFKPSDYGYNIKAI